jgi:hypothetical protein
VGSINQPEPFGIRRYNAARLLLVCSATSFAILWSILWVPVLLTGGQSSLLLYPVVFLLAVLPWCGACMALVLAGRSRNKGVDSRSEVVVGLSAVLLALGPILLWFGPVTL